MKRNIALIDEDDFLDDERYNDPSENEDYSDYDEIGWSTQHTVECHACSSTGEGMVSGTSCPYCYGKGYKIIKN